MASEAVVLSVRMERELRDELDRLAATFNRDKSSLARDAIESFVNQNQLTIQRIERAVEQAKAGQIVPHEEVAANAQAIIAKAYKSVKS